MSYSPSILCQDDKCSQCEGGWCQLELGTVTVMTCDRSDTHPAPAPALEAVENKRLRDALEIIAHGTIPGDDDNKSDKWRVFALATIAETALSQKARE